MVPENVFSNSNSIILTQFLQNKPLICERTFDQLVKFGFFSPKAKKPAIILTDFTSTMNIYVFLKTRGFIFAATQNPAVSEKASTTMSGNVLVYPLKAEAAMSPTVRASPISRLYVTRVNSNTSKPGKISADKYLITISKMGPPHLFISVY
jgi:hypothetical protein